MSENARLSLTPLGGLGEIGLNCMTFSYADDMVMVDCGLMFPEDYHLGVDVVIPRFDFVLERQARLRGIVLTHGHEDHIGALPWLTRLLKTTRIHASPFTLALVEHKLREHGLLEQAELISIDPRSRLSLGVFNFSFFPVSHSIVDGLALGIETPAGRLVHTGDFKLDSNPLSGKGTDLNAIRGFAGKKGARLLLSDSTNVENSGHSMGEREVMDALRAAFRRAKGRILVTLFSSNIQRIQEVFDCARETGRKVVAAGRSLVNNIEISRRLGYLRLPEGLYMEGGELPAALPEDRAVLLLTGSQGEPLSALARIVWGEHKHLRIHPGDTVIMSSRLIPGNTSTVNRMINEMYRQGAEVLYSQVEGIHASGHAYREELAAMLEAVRPEYFIPIHGEYRHLVKHAHLAQARGIPPDNIFVLSNGQTLNFGPEGARPGPSVPAESILVDGKGVGDVGQVVLKERQILGEEGMVVVLLVLRKERKEVAHGPEIHSRGFIFDQYYQHVLDDASNLILELLEEEFPADAEKFQERIRSVLRRFFRRIMGRDPLVMPLVRII
ncbi:MAG: ribonuclease J [Deltaproteobacteria bacterium]|jgi:ribonuclease J|nr:ribonuclease J [Deltaproteobacteria bacterium]